VAPYVLPSTITSAAPSQAAPSVQGEGGGGGVGGASRQRQRAAEAQRESAAPVGQRGLQQEEASLKGELCCPFGLQQLQALPLRAEVRGDDVTGPDADAADVDEGLEAAAPSPPGAPDEARVARRGGGAARDGEDE
jgi:hypothetical protein